MAALFVGCNEPAPEPGQDGGETPGTGVGEFGLELKAVDVDYVELNVSAPAEVDMAYIVETSERANLLPAVIFRSGKTVKVTPGEVLKISGGLNQDTQYYLYAVAKLNDKDYSSIICVEFKTKAYEFNEILTVVDTYYDGYKVHVTVPEEVKQRGNVMRYTAANLAIYNVNKVGYEGIENLLDAQSVVSNGDPYGRYIKNDSTIIINDMNVILTDEDGKPVYDTNGNEIDLHNPVTPNEPTVFIAGECKWGTFDEMSQVLGYEFGIQGSAYVIPMFDKKTYEWTGAFQKKEFFSKAPQLCEETVTITVPDDEVTVTDANIYFKMDKGVSRYFYMVLDTPTYNQIIDVYLDGHEEWMQWFLTSYMAAYEWGVKPNTESIMVNAMQSFYEPLAGSSDYHVVCTVMVDDPDLITEEDPGNGAFQRYIHTTFTTKAKSKGAPVIDVKPVQNGDPYNATFNIKAPNKDVTLAYWACNYAREFQLMFNAKYDYPTILKGNYAMSSDDLAKLNSDEGLTWSFPTLDGEVIRFAVYGANDEYTFNLMSTDKSTEGKGWADYYAPMAPVIPEVESDLYESLIGDWTATAKAVINSADEAGNVTSRVDDLKSKVTISREIPNMPDQLDESVYKLYEGLNVKRSEVDIMFKELKDLSKNFSDYRVKGQNRILCTGFLDYDSYENGRMTYNSPFDLFTNTSYNSVDVPQLLYDFGPKWFLQVQSDGSVVVPFSTAYLPPLHSWPGYPFYLGGVSEKLNAFTDGEGAKPESIPGFPVVVSEDRNQIIIKPIVREDESFYMNAIGNNNGSYELIARLNSEIVLTRGWDGSATNPAAAPKAKPASVKGIDGVPAERVFKSMTDFSKVEPRHEYKVVENPNIVTMEMVNRTTQRILNNEFYY